MKTTRMLLTIIFCLFCSILSHAQTGKGNMLLGGNASMSFSSHTSNKSFYASLSPGVGIFVVDRFAVGASVPCNYSSFSLTSSRYLGIGIGPFVRYYLGAGKGVPFLEAKGGLNFSRSRYEESSGIERKETQNTGYGSLGLGLAYFLTPAISLESVLSYNLYRQNSYTNRSLSLNIGFQIYFDRNQE